MPAKDVEKVKVSPAKISALFGALHSAKFRVASSATEGAEQARIRLKPKEAYEFLNAIREPLTAAAESGVFADPWAAAALRRDEVRNASVLAWFLNPRNNHGCGDELLRFLVAQVQEHYAYHPQESMRKEFPGEPTVRAIVSTEQPYDGLRDSRVDIQIDDRNSFFLIIEVKIDAAEQPWQIKRYCEIARARAYNDNWAVVFLTLSGHKPKTATKVDLPHVVPLSWSALSVALRQVAFRSPEGDLRPISATARFLALAFANHIANF